MVRIAASKRRIVPVLGLLAALLALCAPPAAQADVGQKIIRLCAQGKSLAGFPPGDYAKALKEISATTEEYSECGQLIRAAQQAAASGKGGGSGSAGALPTAVAATPAEQRSIAGAAKSGSAPVSLGGQVIHPGVVHANIASAFSKLPAPLLALLGFVLACLLVLAARPLRDRIRDRGSD
jgi:hypothetical protein